MRANNRVKRSREDLDGLLFPEMVENPWRTSRCTALDDCGATCAAGSLTAVELCAGAGGQALGLEQAGLSHTSLIEIDKNACATLRMNRPEWKVIEQDLNNFDGAALRGVDVIAGGLPCPPFSIAGKQLGRDDERNLFPAMIRLVDQIRPRAVMIENVRGILEAIFHDYRQCIAGELNKLGYKSGWNLVNASDFGVPQLRPRVVFIALRNEYSERFSWPAPSDNRPKTVGEVLYDLMKAGGWPGARAWREKANEIAPTIVGGSHKHGGPDLGPTRARRAWAALGVDGLGIADEPPRREFVGKPKLTVRMVARLQGFPDDWQFFGRKTAAYRQVGNAFPPPVARAIGESLKACLLAPRFVKVAG